MNIWVGKNDEEWYQVYSSQKGNEGPKGWTGDEWLAVYDALDRHPFVTYDGADYHFHGRRVQIRIEWEQ
jgi:hypothetical protein